MVESVADKLDRMTYEEQAEWIAARGKEIMRQVRGGAAGDYKLGSTALGCADVGTQVQNEKTMAEAGIDAKYNRHTGQLSFRGGLAAHDKIMGLNGFGK